jgi:hypothetical protein
MQQKKHHYVALHLEEYELLALEAHFDVWRVHAQMGALIWVSRKPLMVTIVMPMSFYRCKNLLKWILFKDLNLNIYMMHKIIL